MSKRHRKSKDMLSATSGGYEDMMVYDPTMFEAPRSKKFKGKHKRQSLKRAYYDD